MVPTDIINDTARYYIERIKEICKEKKPLVVIRCITFNHEPYLKDALEGFLMQKTDFPFVAIIHEDASTDGTAEVLREYADKYPDIILPIFEKENQYSKKNGNLRRIVDHACKISGAKYIAICEGDDYWTDPLKLQKQINFLESHQDYGMCYTRANILKGDKFIGKAGKKDTSLKGLISYSNFPTLTRVYSLSVYEKYINEVNPDTQAWMMGDYPFAFYCVLKSKVGFIDELTSVYRILEDSASHSKKTEYLVKFYGSADDVRYFFVNNYIINEAERKNLLFKIKQNEINYKLSIFLRSNNIIEAKNYYKKHHGMVTLKNTVRYYFTVWSPSLISMLYTINKNIKRFLCR